jgi:hypothetical protein
MEILDLLNNGIRANIDDKYRHGNLIRLAASGSLILTGDIHGHQRNFQKIITFADLENHPDRHLLLQEIIHGGPEGPQGGCLSYKLLFEAVRYKVKFPDRVHIIMGNHDTAYITDRNIIKNGREMNRAMNIAIDAEFGEKSPDVRDAIKQFLFSQPLAIKTENKIWASHSLPNQRNIDEFDPGIFERELTLEDFKKPGSAYLLTWGRNHKQPLLDRLAELLEIDTFILGHQAQQQGSSRAGENLIIIASDHGHGCLVSIDTDKTYNVEMLIESIVPLASIP